MYTVYLISSVFSGYYPLFMDIVLLTAGFCAVLVIVNKNPIISVIFLIVLFSVIAVYLIFVGLEFIGLAYLLVYVGAVSILFLFILMLINVRISEISQISSIGNILYTSYSLWLLIVSLILLLAMIGAILITVKSKNFSLNNVIESLQKNIINKRL